LSYKTPNVVTEGKRAVRATPMKLNRAVGAHDNHTVHHKSNKQGPREIHEQKGTEKWQHANGRKPIDKRNPILFSIKNIDS